MTYLVLSLATIPVLVFLAAQDFKERMIYSFPVLFLTGGWAMHSVMLYLDRPFVLIGAWSTAIALYIAYRVCSVWGDGDSDMWLLFTGIILCTFDVWNMLQYGFLLCICLAGAQIAALIAGLIEAAIKERKLDRHSDLAVVPGFAVILIAILIYGFSREVCIL